MNDRTIIASRFKATCLAVLDEVERTGRPVVVTKRGRPVVRVVPIEETGGPRSTENSVRLLAEEDEAYFGTGDRWDAEQET
jgi:prevent-host-death family protein